MARCSSCNGAAAVDEISRHFILVIPARLLLAIVSMTMVGLP
jgi:hypothetical protein